MKVKLKANWFAPTEVEEIGNRKLSGQRYRAGVVEIPNNLKPFLPSDAEILDEDYKEAVKAEPVKTFKDFDNERANSDALQAIVNRKSK